jgi:hypothetical protein
MVPLSSQISLINASYLLMDYYTRPCQKLGMENEFFAE